jgi:hypothetical protein
MLHLPTPLSLEVGMGVRDIFAKFLANASGWMQAACKGTSVIDPLQSPCQCLFSNNH